jgi:hypothetical protein
MRSFLPILCQEYARLQTRFGPQLLGVVEIGSFAHGEAVSSSDHDLRLIIQCAKPLLVLNEHLWTDGISDATATVDWQDLNQGHDLSFGLTNLAFIEHGLQADRYPLVDHTCLYQGCILLDDTKAIATFRARYYGVRFSNIVPDYLRQVEWRVTSRLPSELRTLTERLDHRKYAVPLVHTCYRIVRDLANIASYHAHGVYVSDSDTLAHYYREHWPWFESTFQTLRAYKTDERQRQAVFNDIEQHNPERLRHIELCAEATVSLWEQFQGQYR